MRLLSRVLAAVLLATVLFHSAPVEAATKPSAPRSVKATPLNKAVKVTWAAPSSRGTSAINAYAVQRRNTTSSPWVTVKFTGATARAWTETGLVNGARFYYRVMARNGSGWGTASAQVSAVPRTVPAVPRFPEADAYNAALGAYWQIPSTNGGVPIDSYQIQWSADGGSTWTGSVTSPAARTQAAPAMVPLTPGTRYWLRIRAHNAAGYGPTTGFGPYTVRTAPGPVTDLAATPGLGQVELSWTAPIVGTPVGSTAVASYKVESSADGGTTWTTEPSTTATSTVVTGLTGGIAYQFRVSAKSVVDNIGYGPSTVIAPDAPTGAPSAPQNVTLGWDEGVGQFRFGWQPPASDGGRDLTRYEVVWSGPNPGSHDYPADVTHADLPTVPLDHEIQVRACNGPAVEDCGPWSASLGPVTDRVVDLQAGQSMAGTVRTVHVDWGEPANGLATSYDVLRSDDGGTTFTPAATVLAPATSYDDTTTLASTQYVYKVVPHGGGTGEPRTTSITTGLDQTLSITPQTINVTEGSPTGAQVVLGVATSVLTEIAVAVTDPDLATTTTATVQVAAGQTTAAVTVTGTQDDDLVGGTTTLTASLATLEATATVDVTDNDSQAIIAPAAVPVADGATAGVDVRLLYVPTEPVTVTVGITQNGNKIDIVGDVTELHFDADNWDQPQALQVHRNSSGAATVNLTAPGATAANVAITEP